MVEIGRFLLTAIAVSLTIPALFMLVLQIRVSESSFEIYVLAATICLGLSVVGGVLVGLPTLWLAKRWNWHERIGHMAILGAVAGSFAAGLVMLPATPDLGGIVMWAVFGAAAGLVAAPIWVLLHRSDADPEPV